MNARPYNVLFLCTGNSARSILAESMLNQEGHGRFRAYSAGSHPKGEIHPFAVQWLKRFDYPTDGLRSKSWHEFELPGAPIMDFVFTVCDNAAGEICPVCPAWPGQPMTAHWGIEDPSSVEGSEVERKAAFSAAALYLKNRITALTALPLERLAHIALRHELQDIGQLEGATTMARIPPTTSA